MHRPPIPVESLELHGFDGSSAGPCRVSRPDRYRHLEMLPREQGLSVRGGGFSYWPIGADRESLVVDVTRFDRILALDTAARRVVVEGGAAVMGLSRALARHALHCPVLPGHPLITVGGCIAANVHGKNPWRDGLFCDHVLEITLYHPHSGFLTVSRQHRPDVFDLTCGGFGMTGIIVSATLQLQPLPGHAVELENRHSDSWADTLGMLRRHAGDYDIAYAWHGRGLRKGDMDRGLVFLGRLTHDTIAMQPAAARPPQAMRFRLPFGVMSAPLSRVLGEYFRLRHELPGSRRRLAVLDAYFPLAGSGHFFALFGRHGLRECQVLLPAQSMEDSLATLNALVHDYRNCVAFCAFRLFDTGRRFLCYGGKGVSVSVVMRRSPAASRLADGIYELLGRTGGVPNLTKDSDVPGDVLRPLFPERDRFAENLRNYDPRRCMNSGVARKLEL